MNSLISRIKNVAKLVLCHVENFFPHFFAFYVISLLLSFLFKFWAGFFNWKFFHISVLVLALLSLLGSRIKKQ